MGSIKNIVKDANRWRDLVAMTATPDDDLMAADEIERRQKIINDQTELIRKYETDVAQLEYLLKSYKDIVDQ